MEAVQALKQFETLNRIRIERLCELAPKSQQDFFDLLALLFHLNSEDLPGYISGDTPAGIVNYQPSNAVIEAAQLINPQFNFKRRPLRHYPILGVYLINDNATLHYPEVAEFELWLVHASLATQDKSLQQKLNAIETWAKSLNITLTTRLLSEQSLSQNSLSTDDLNRFYLNGLVLGGSAPLWWAISPEQEDQNYQQAAAVLTQQRYLGHTSIIDFGPLPKANAQHLFEQTASILLQAMEHGLQPVLNLVYHQYLLISFPDYPWCCQQFKLALYQGEKDPLAIDANVLKLEALMASSKVNNEQQLLAQQSLYTAFNERLSQHVSQARYPWRRDFLKQCVQSWQWPQHQSQTLDQRQNSNYRQCHSEFQQASELHVSVQQTLNQFAATHQLDITPTNNQFKQQLQLLHDAGPDTIPYLANSLLPRNTEEYVYLYRFSAKGDWLINDIPLSSAKEQALFKAPSLLHVLTWAVRNHLLIRSNQLKIADNSEQVTVGLVLKLVKQLLTSPIALPSPSFTELDLAKPAECHHVMLFINLEQEGPQDTLAQQGLVRSSLKNDPLSYALNKQNLIFGIEGLIYSSWGQWHYFSHTRNTAVAEMLTAILRWQPKNTEAELTLCWCPSDSHGKAIERRLTKLYKEVITHYQAHNDYGTYLLPLSESLCTIQWQPGSCDYSLATKSQQTVDILGAVRSQFSHTKVDVYLDPTGLYAQLLRLQSATQITVFMYFKKKIITLYLLDEQGTLYQHSFKDLTESTINGHYHRFLSSIKQKNKVEHLRFYRLAKSVTKDWSIAAMPLTNSSLTSYLPVTIEMASSADDAECVVHCGPKNFSGKANDQALFKQIKSLVLSLRKSQANYPLYITDLAFPQQMHLPTYQYIMHKERLENLLNN